MNLSFHKPKVVGSKPTAANSRNPQVNRRIGAEPAPDATGNGMGSNAPRSGLRMPNGGGEAGGESPRDAWWNRCGKKPAVPAALAGLGRLEWWRGPRPGIYFLLRKGRVVYVGQNSGSVDARIYSHSTDRTKPFDDAWWFPCARANLNELERHYIDLFHPPYNCDPASCRHRGETRAERDKAHLMRAKEARECDDVYQAWHRQQQAWALALAVQLPLAAAPNSINPNPHSGKAALRVALHSGEVRS
jgi:hypothetical protein